MSYTTFPRVQYQAVPDVRSHSPVAKPLVIRSARPAYLRNQAASTPTVSGPSSGPSAALRLTSPSGSRSIPPFPEMSEGGDATLASFWQRFCATQEILARNISDLAFDQFEQTVSGMRVEC